MESETSLSIIFKLTEMIRGNEPAMPVMDTNLIEGQPNLTLMSEGLTIREHFASMAMQGMLSACNGYCTNQNGEADNLAYCAVAHADALIRELNK